MVRDDKLQNNELSLRVSSEAILNFIQESFPDAYKLFYMLSLMPSGATPTQLQRIWGPSQQKCAEILQGFNLLETDSKGRLKLTPYMMCFAE